MLNEDINIFLGMFSYPYVSVDFLFKDILQTYYDKQNPSLQDKQTIRKAFRNYINGKYNIYNYDEIYLYLDKWYLYPHYDKKKRLIKYDTFDIILQHLERFSTVFIAQRDGGIVYKYWKNDEDHDFLGGFSDTNKIYLFHSLNRLIPLDILIIIYMIKNNKNIRDLDGNYGNILVSDKLLDRVMEKGVAENHLHRGASVTFLTAWDAYMCPLTAQNRHKLMHLEIPGDDFNSIRSCTNVYLLMLANYIRTIILFKLRNVKEIINEECTETILENEISYLIKTFCGDGLAKQLAAFCPKDKVKGLSKWYYFEEKYQALRKLVNLSSLSVQSLFPEEYTGKTSSENFFLFKAMSYIYDENSSGEEQKIIKNLLLNYLRIKNHFYQLVVQQKTIHGLNHFQEAFYHNSSDFTSIKMNFSWERALREQFQNENLKKLELRGAIGTNEAKFKTAIDNFLKAYLKVLHSDYCVIDNDDVKNLKYVPEVPFPRVGLVFHLLKEEEKLDFKDVLFTGYYKDDIRYRKLYQRYKQEIALLLALRNKHEIYSKYLLGIDVASLESAVPTWVYVDIFKSARGSGIEKISRGIKKNKSLAFTFHAGEDFRHILSALRRIYEVIIHLKFHVGDRIGHGVALGIAPEDWHIKNKTIIIPRIEALENYIWLYDLLSSNDARELVGNLDYIENQIHKLSMEIYGNKHNLSIKLLVEAYKALFNRNMLDLDYLSSEYWKFKNYLDNNYRELKSDEFNYNVDNLVYSRYCHGLVYKMQEPVHMKIEEQEIIITQVAQRIMKQMVNKMGIVVEVNPSSNIVIGDMDTIKDNQVYSLNNYGYNFDNMIVNINSDDPSVFNTNAANELGYIYFGMLERGVNREAALSWIDKLRQNSMDTSFIYSKENDERLLRDLEKFVGKL